MAQTKEAVASVIAGIGGQEVTYEDVADFIRKRRVGTETWFGVNNNV
jgi:pyruvate ferredoxin oxidoreductase alpha subunit